MLRLLHLLEGTMSMPVYCPECGSNDTSIEIDVGYIARNIAGSVPGETDIELELEIPIVMHCAACDRRVGEAYACPTVQLLIPEEE